MSSALGAIGLFLGIATLIFLGWKGVHTIVSAIAAALVVIIFNWMNFWDTFNNSFLFGASGFVQQYFLLFILGALFGEVMARSGSSKKIAEVIFNALGEKFTILALVLVTMLLSYAGINIFVIVFVLYPLAKPMLKAANISRNILPALMLFAGVTMMLPAPGSPTGTNLTPTTVLGTTAYAGTAMGLICMAVAFVIGYVFLTRSAKHLKAQGIGYEEPPAVAGDTVTEAADEADPHFFCALLPIVTVIVVVFLTKGVLASFDSINTGLASGVAMTMLLNLKVFKTYAMPSMVKGITSSFSPLLTTAAIVGFGSVVQASAGFTTFLNLAVWLSEAFNPYISGILSINIMSGICGAAIPGIRIFSNTMLPTYLSMDINPEAMHRILVIAAGGLETLPHCSTIAILYGVMGGLNHKKCYKYIFVVSVALPLLMAFLAAGLAMIGIV